MKKQQKQLDKKDIINFLKKNKIFLKKEFGVIEIALFGSYARNEQTLKSDVDLLIETKEHDFRNRLRIKEFLENEFNKKVDLLYFDAVRKFIRRNIEEDIIYA